MNSLVTEKGSTYVFHKVLYCPIEKWLREVDDEVLIQLGRYNYERHPKKQRSLGTRITLTPHYKVYQQLLISYKGTDLGPVYLFHTNMEKNN